MAGKLMSLSKKIMSQERKDTDVRNNDTSKPDKGTLHTTDPQEHMEGPVSSSMKEMGKAFDTEESKKEADEKREEKI
jgi:hypothetical protein